MSAVFITDDALYTGVVLRRSDGSHVSLSAAQVEAAERVARALKALLDAHDTLDDYAARREARAALAALEAANA